MRTDVYLQNDSHGMSVLSSSVVDRVIAAGLGNDEPFVRAHEAVLGLLVGDDAFIARVVVDEPLSKTEQDEWIAHYRTALSVPCGRLLVCGGFDPDVLGWWKEGKTQGVKDITIPPGKYLVDVYTYLHSMNGRVICADIWEEKLGAWFRRDHPGRVFPAWVAGELAMFNDDDPGHEKEWKALASSVQAGTLAVETAPLDWVTFLIHLRPFDPKAKLDEPEEGTWFGAGQGMRRPTRFPLGLSSDEAEDPEYREALAALLPKKPEQQPKVEALEVFSHVQQLPLRPVSGGSVTVPAALVARVYRLAWFTTGFVQPEMRLEGPAVAALARHFEATAVPVVEGGALLIRLAGGAGSATLTRMGKIGADPWAHVPAGTTLELATRALEATDSSLGGPGFTRFRGPISVQGDQRIWTISEAYPTVSAEMLRRALALSAAAEAEDRLTCASPEEAQRVLTAFTEGWGYMMYPWTKLTRNGAELRLAPPDGGTIHFIALAGFRSLFGTTWPCDVKDDPVEGEEED